MGITEWMGAEEMRSDGATTGTSEGTPAWEVGKDAWEQGSCLYWPDLGKQGLTHQLQKHECACIYVCVYCEGCGLSDHEQSDCGHALHVHHMYRREHR